VAKSKRSRTDAANADATPREPQDPQWLKILMALLGVAIVVFVMYVVLNPGLGRDALGSVLVKGLFAIACGLIGGFFSGSLTVRGKVPGLAVRAGGGLALGVLVFFFAPKVADAVLPEAGGLSSIDYRSSRPSDTFALGRNEGNLLVTTDVAVDNRSAGPIVWRSSRATLELGGRKIPFRTLYFTNFVHATEPWLGQGPVPAQEVNVPPGEAVHKEVMFIPVRTAGKRYGWDDFLGAVTASGGGKPVFRVALSVGGSGAQAEPITLSCVGDVDEFAEILRDYVAKGVVSAPRATLDCRNLERSIS
jgi:hypothetical protein